MSEWRDIETAPKDGRHVMLAITNDPPGSPGYVAEGYYEVDGDRGWFASNTHWTDQCDGSLFPSHWMPLPEAPIIGTSAERTSAERETAR